MSDDTPLTCQIDGCDYSGSHIGLRSHVHGQSDQSHTDAANAEAWEDWYPEAYGTEPDPEEPDDDPDPSDDTDDDPDPEGGAGTAAVTDSDADSDPDDVTPDSDEYAEQYRRTDDPEPDTVDAGTATPVEPDTPDGGGMNWGVLLAGAAALAGAVLLSGRSSTSAQAAPTSSGGQDVPDDPNDALALTPEGGEAATAGAVDGITMEDGEVFG